MKSSLRRAAVGSLACVGMTVAAAGLAHADGGRRVITEVPQWTAHAARTGAPARTDRLHLSMVLSLRDPAGAQALADAVSDPSAATYGQYLTAAQWRVRFAPTDADAAAVSAWLSSQGFTVTGSPANHRYISFDATAGQANAAFGAQLATFAKDRTQVLAPTAPVSVPTAIADLVAGVAGLDTSQRSRPDNAGGPNASGTDGGNGPTATPQSATGARPAGPNATLPPPGPVFRNAGPCSAYFGEKPATGLPQLVTNRQTYVPCGYTPAQLRGAYGTDAAQAAGFDGRGATVAVVDAFASPTIFKDASTYAKRHDPRHPLRSYQFNQVTPATYTFTNECGAPGWYGEETLDVEAVHATAPAANILYVGASSCQNLDLVAAVNTVLDNDLAQVITNSYGSAGEPQPGPELTAEHESALQAAAQGVSLLFSSGDSGDEIVATGTRQVDYQASDPYVTAVGGTSLMVTKTNGYGGEQGWGTGRSVLTNGAWVPNPPAYQYGGGGGTSQLFKQPKYQRGVVPDRIANYFGQGPHRAVPDLAMVGDPNTGFLVGQTQTFPDGSLQYSEYRIGGTSLSSPLLAGVVAVGNQVKGASLGFLNPRLYKLAGTSALTDVDHGRAVTDAVVRVDYVNGFDASGGLRTTLRTLNQTGTIYTAKGYDDVTGVGSPNGVPFLLGMAGGHTTGQNEQNGQNGPGGGAGQGGQGAGPGFASGTPAR